MVQDFEVRHEDKSKLRDLPIGWKACQTLKSKKMYWDVVLMATPWRALRYQNLLRIKVTLPQRCRMHFQEFIPCYFTTFQSRIESVLLQDILDGVARRWINAQLFEFPHDPGVAPVVFSRAMRMPREPTQNGWMNVIYT